MTTETEKHKQETREFAEIRNRVETKYQSIRLGDPLEEPCPGCGCVTFATARKDVSTLLTSLAARDREVREVLEGLRQPSGCWCSGYRGHSDDCKATCALYNRLQPAKEGEDGN